MKTSDFYIIESKKILKDVEEPIIVEFNNLLSTDMDIYYEEDGAVTYFTLRSLATHHKVRFASAESFIGFLHRNASLLDRRFVAVAYVNKKPIIINPKKEDKTQKRSSK